MIRHTAALAAILILAACGRESATPTAVAAAGAPLISRAGDGASVHRDLAVLRQVTAAARDTIAAADAGWSAQITGCLAAPNEGAMGYHYGNGGYIEDGILRVDQPELLLYEPTKNGGRRLVGVEYVILYRDWPRDATPPVLFGQEFAKVDAFGLWGLHAWVWAENPRGMFAPWNPRVSCEFAPPIAGAPAAARHH